MKIAKIIVKDKSKFVEVVKVESVKFDPRPGWVFVKEIEKRHGEVFWVHPCETRFEWVREFSF